jgi:anti-sigma factor RsiW
MKCIDVRKLLNGYIDLELSTEQSEMIESHLQSCKQCSEQYIQLENLCSVTKKSRQYSAPYSLKQQISLSLQESGEDIESDSEKQLRQPKLHVQHWFRYGVPSLMLGVVFGFGLYFMALTGYQNDNAVQSVVAAHVRSQYVDHLVDIASSDRHTVKPWFNGKLDFSPPVKDYTKEGFPLIGGRLDYLFDRPVAALLYRHRQHVINLFVRPMSGQENKRTEINHQGYNILRWTEAGLEYWAISDLNINDMEKFRQMLIVNVE